MLFMYCNRKHKTGVRFEYRKLPVETISVHSMLHGISIQNIQIMVTDSVKNEHLIEFAYNFSLNLSFANSLIHLPERTKTHSFYLALFFFS